MQKRTIYKFAFGMLCITAGIMLNYLNLGTNWFAGFGTVGNWLVYVGMLSIFVAVLHGFKKKEKLADERAYFIAAKANRITFLVIVIASFLIMILDGINPIDLAYHIFMSYLVCGMLVVYALSYKILEKLN